VSKKGLSTSVLGSHLGFDVPAVVRRGGAGPLHSVAPEAMEPAEQGRAAESAGPPAHAKEPAHPHKPLVEDTRQEASPAASVDQNADNRASPDEEAASAREAELDEEMDTPRAHDSQEVRRSSSTPVTKRKPPMRIESRSSVYRVGTQRAPYERADGTKTEKAGFTAPHGFKEEINLFCLTHRLGTTSEWIVATLRKEMERARRKS